MIDDELTDPIEADASAEVQIEPPTIDELEENYSKIDRTLSKGVRRVRHKNKEVEYDLASLEKTRRRKADELEEAKASERGIKRLRQVRVSARRGY